MSIKMNAVYNPLYGQAIVTIDGHTDGHNGDVRMTDAQIVELWQLMREGRETGLPMHSITTSPALASADIYGEVYSARSERIGEYAA